MENQNFIPHERSYAMYLVTGVTSPSVSNCLRMVRETRLANEFISFHFICLPDGILPQVFWHVSRICLC